MRPCKIALSELVKRGGGTQRLNRSKLGSIDKIHVRGGTSKAKLADALFNLT